MNLFAWEILKIYTKAIVGIHENGRYDLTRYNWTYFYQELEDAVSTFSFKASTHIVTDRVVNHFTTEFTNFISYYNLITQYIMS